jgi:hypothetical protein
MAITPLILKYDADLEEIFRIMNTAGLEKRSRLEVVECWDMIQIWQTWVKEKFGQITMVRHRSQPDDPPDLELVFPQQIVGMEHTRLQPKHLGQAAALMRKSGQGGFIPPIGSPPKTLDELQDIIAGVKHTWSNTIDDWRAVFDLLAITLREKMRGIPNGGIIGVVHDLVVSATDQHLLAEIAHNIVNRDEFADFEGYTLVLLDRANMHQFHSALVRRGEDIREHRR